MGQAAHTPLVVLTRALKRIIWVRYTTFRSFPKITSTTWHAEHKIRHHARSQHRYPWTADEWIETFLLPKFADVPETEELLLQ